MWNLRAFKMVRIVVPSTEYAGLDGSAFVALSKMIRIVEFEAPSPTLASSALNNFSCSAINCEMASESALGGNRKS